VSAVCPAGTGKDRHCRPADLDYAQNAHRNAGALRISRRLKIGYETLLRFLLLLWFASS
jgi:hypothetical protein